MKKKQQEFFYNISTDFAVLLRLPCSAVFHVKMLLF